MIVPSGLPSIDGIRWELVTVITHPREEDKKFYIIFTALAISQIAFVFVFAVTVITPREAS